MTATNAFLSRIAASGCTLNRTRLRVLQVNVGKLCNLTCTHCHVNAGPARREIISRQTVDRILDWVAKHPVSCIDLTGGAPEMIPDFQYFILGLRDILPDASIIDRCNLSILAQPGYEWVAPFLLENQVDIIASMPCYLPDNVNQQRGQGVFNDSIEALKLLNSLSYGLEGSNRHLHLVYNPNGAFLPGDQAKLEADYKEHLLHSYNISFHKLLTITNMPIARFASWLKNQGTLADYMNLLQNSFNPSTIHGLMCRDTLSVSWTGTVHDCDFNQMLDLPTFSSQPRKLWDIHPNDLAQTPIVTASHCFGCTAGAGSSCGGSLA